MSKTELYEKAFDAGKAEAFAEIEAKQNKEKAKAEKEKAAAEKKEKAAKEKAVYLYLGEGEYIRGVPKKHLTQEDLDKLSKKKVKEVSKSKLYKLAKKA